MDTCRLLNSHYCEQTRWTRLVYAGTNPLFLQGVFVRGRYVVTICIQPEATNYTVIARIEGAPTGHSVVDILAQALEGHRFYPLTTFLTSDRWQADESCYFTDLVLPSSQMPRDLVELLPRPIGIRQIGQKVTV